MRARHQDVIVRNGNDDNDGPAKPLIQNKDTLEERPMDDSDSNQRPLKKRKLLPDMFGEPRFANREAKDFSFVRQKLVSCFSKDNKTAL